MDRTDTEISEKKKNVPQDATSMRSPLWDMLYIYLPAQLLG